jgi:predicted dehydrogenase
MWLVGAGYWGSKLIDNLKKFDVNAQVIDIKNGQSISDINTSDPVMLATPLWQHHNQAIELLRRGHDVYVEKPLAETVAQVQEIGHCVVPGQLLMVGHLFVHHPQMAEIKSIIADGVIGNVTHVSSSRLNWGIYQTRTDPLLSLATHDIAIIQEITGSYTMPDQVHGWNYSNNQQHDRITFSGQCTSGVTFDVDVSWHWPVRTRQTVLLGTQGQIVWDQDANTITVSGNQIVERRAVVDPAPTVLVYNHALTPLEAELEHWINCVSTRTEPSTGLEAARSVAQTIDQVKQLL